MNMITEVKDLYKKDIHVGDRVAWSEKASTSTSFLCAGEVISIKAKPITTEIYVRIQKWGDPFFERPEIGKIRCFIYPREYYNLIVIN